MFLHALSSLVLGAQQLTLVSPGLGSSMVYRHHRDTDCFGII